MTAAIRRSLLGALVFGAASVAGCGSSGEKVERPGCHGYCLQAGRFGGDATAGRAIVRLAAPPVAKVAVEGFVAVKVSCLVPRTCVGRLVMEADPQLSGSVVRQGLELGRSDLRVEARKTATIGLDLSAAAGRYVRRVRRVPATVSAETSPTLPSLSSFGGTQEWATLVEKKLVVRARGG